MLYFIKFQREKFEEQLANGTFLIGKKAATFDMGQGDGDDE